jgi:hypothetical protein
LSSINPGFARANAFEIRQGMASCRELRVLDQHVGDLIFDGEPGPASRADKRFAFEAEGGLSDRANDQGQQFFIDHTVFSSDE